MTCLELRREPTIAAASGLELVKALEKIGFYEIAGGKGSHRKLSNGLRTVIVPTHRGAVPVGTLASILRQAGISADDLRELL
ncbi:MAG: type II toxin-antitoxin system HicA family toxin [Streptosporangiaceae bacterium]